MSEAGNPPRNTHAGSKERAPTPPPAAQRRSSLRKTAPIRRTPPDTSSDEATPRVKEAETAPRAEIIRPRRVPRPIPDELPPPRRRSSAKRPHSPRTMASPRSMAVDSAPSAPPPTPDVTASVASYQNFLSSKPSSPPQSTEEKSEAISVREEAGQAADAGAAVGSPPETVVDKVPSTGRKSPPEKGSSARRKDISSRSSRLTAADEKLMQSALRVEKLEGILLTPASSSMQQYMPSINNAADLKKFVECDLSLSILRRLEAVKKAVGHGGKSIDLQFHPFWIETSYRQSNEKVLKMIYEFLFVLSAEEKNDESVLRNNSNEIAEALKYFNPDVSNQWVQNVLGEMSRLRNQSQMLAWIGSIMQKRCRASILGLDSRVNKLQYSLEAPLNSARIMEGWTELESKKTFVLENEQVIRFITDQCRRIQEMQSVNVQSTIPSRDTLSQFRTRLNALQDEVTQVSKLVAKFDAQLVAVSDQIQRANQLFTSVVLGLAA
eukprot:Gregarina_sp_Poly_1__4410@NODE_237_length_10947_cov_116_066912_g209_i0_p3_GENE_NODE_237_length_10947_cov_116_066912_g209_i0NODE_237_length_10947_cov_116_066912_g209_i0_p3_ORF_typecomplete_len494_score81_40Dynactin_p22/PF07426_11/5_3e03Dynactin_p22/PF07426_11/4_3e02Dynactin_p22/PF07426_11/0_0011Sec3_C/PF09763_9/2e02Sec3_C/PF09763_9/0_0067Bacillus_HBL/PF05791_11/6_3e03Bacillus_HBL/PF05791_11/0_066TolA_bind_tri/PF16331_5/0_25TolA_bind_tri/PF16331_5/6_2e02Baculo_PEP_C/PF04513_12/2_4e02Baculo_PEP_C/P